MQSMFMWFKWGNDVRSQSSGGTSLLSILTSITLAQSHISPDHCQKNQEYYQCKKKISSKLISHKINTHVVTMCNFTNWNTIYPFFFVSTYVSLVLNFKRLVLWFLKYFHFICLLVSVFLIKCLCFSSHLFALMSLFMIIAAFYISHSEKLHHMVRSHIFYCKESLR